MFDWKIVILGSVNCNDNNTYQKMHHVQCNQWLYVMTLNTENVPNVVSHHHHHRHRQCWTMWINDNYNRNMFYNILKCFMTYFESMAEIIEQFVELESVALKLYCYGPSMGCGWYCGIGYGCIVWLGSGYIWFGGTDGHLIVSFNMVHLPVRCLIFIWLYSGRENYLRKNDCRRL